MRVLFVNPGLGLGGAEHSLLLLLQVLRSRGIDTRVAVFGDGPFRERVIHLGFPTETLKVPATVRLATRYKVSGPAVFGAIASGLPATLRLAALVRREAVDLVHTNGLKAHLLGGLAGSMTGVPVIWHVRDFPPPGMAGRVFRHAASWLPSLLLANSHAVAAAYGPMDRRRPAAVIAPNPVDLEQFRPGRPRRAIRLALGLDPDGPLIGQIAHLTPWKGHELFLTIARQVHQHVPRASFVVVGGAIYETDGHKDYEARLRQRAVDLGIAERVTFLGSRDDVAEILAALDLIVHCPTAPEPFGRVLAEAMAAGLPVVAARSGGVPEVVTDGVTGILVSQGDAPAFTAAVVELLSDCGLRERFSQAGRTRAERTFQIDSHAARVLEAYARVTGPPRVAA